MNLSFKKGEMSLSVEEIFGCGHCDCTEADFDPVCASFEMDLNQYNSHVENAETLRNLVHISEGIILGKIALWMVSSQDSDIFYSVICRLKSLIEVFLDLRSNHLDYLLK